MVLRLGHTETLSTDDGKFFVVEFSRSQGEVTFDIRSVNTGKLFAQSISAYGALYRAKKDARQTLKQMSECL